MQSRDRSKGNNVGNGLANVASSRTRDYFAEMYMAGVLADSGWDIYFPRRDKGFDMIVSRPSEATTIVRPVQVKGNASDEKTDKKAYGYVGRLTAFHDNMILAIPYLPHQARLHL